MSDGAISQDEIEALLSGVDLGGGGMGAPMQSSAPDTSHLEKFIGDTAGAFASGIETMTGVSFSVGKPSTEIMPRDMLLMKIPDMVVSVVADFTSGLQGEHVFLLPPEFVQKITSLVNKEDNADIDDMALSVISELVSQHIGTEITALERTGKFSGVVNAPAEGVHIPKASVSLRKDSYAVFAYPISGDGGNFTVWEAMDADMANNITNALGGGNNAQPSFGGSGGGLSADEMASLGSFGGMSTPAMDMGGMNGMSGMSVPNMNIPNVQSLQYPNLQAGMNNTEQGNIGLIMDVYMEMTVELGRTKKQIKEILGMGEGTIIELDKLAGEPVDILVNHKAIAKGEVVVIDENFGVRVTEILSPIERVSDLQ